MVVSILTIIFAIAAIIISVITIKGIIVNEKRIRELEEYYRRRQ